MSTAAAAEAAPPKAGKKKLIIIIGVVLLVVVIGAVAAMLLMKKKPVDEEGEDAHADEPAKAAVHKDPKHAPTFVPLEPFTVNLADRDAERYAQVGVTLEVEDPKVGEQIKAYMPAIRNNILLALADKTAAQLMERGGKTKLAEQMRRETARAMGYEVEEPEPEAAAEEEDSKPAKPAKKKAAKKKKEAPLPVSAVHFNNFIIQ